MKKSILIFCTVVITFSLTAFGFMNSKTSMEADPDLVYNVDSRFIANITKEDLHNAKSIIDIVPRKATQTLESYHDVKVAILDEDNETVAMGEDEFLNFAQIMLLQSADYSTNFYINARCTNKNPDTGEMEGYDLVYYITVIPEKEAVFTGGQDALIAYLKENSREKTTLIKQNKLKPGRFCFSVTKEGKIANVKLEATSGYPSVDETLIELLTNMPGKWEPATNSAGEKVNQEFVFFFGLQGC